MKERFEVPCKVCGTVTLLTKRAIDTGRGKFCSHACSCKFNKPAMDAGRTHLVRDFKREYSTWSAMKQQCTNPNYDAYALYGAKGIILCERWMTFKNFLEDMGPRPMGTSIDRIDGSKGYEPGNCRWATNAVQTRNKRTNVIVSYKGKEYIRQDLANLLNITNESLTYRINSGWPESEYGKPMRKDKRRKV